MPSAVATRRWLSQSPCRQGCPLPPVTPDSEQFFRVFGGAFAGDRLHPRQCATSPSESPVAVASALEDTSSFRYRLFT